MRQSRLFLASAVVVLLGVNLAGCVVGPTSIRLGRNVYNEVINQTEDEQLLNMIVHDRYQETYGMLAVASVTSSIRASANIQAQFGLSRSLREDYTGQLIPLAGGVAYEENPTISYVPLGGEQFVQRLLSPLSVEECLLMAQYLRQRRSIYSHVGIRSLNGVRNPYGTSEDPASDKFHRLLELWEQLKLAGVLRFGRDASGDPVAAIHADDPEHGEAVKELLELTRITKPPSGGWLILPLRVTAYGWDDDAFNFETHSVLEMLRTAGACIEIPQAHLDAGVVEPPLERAPRFMTIRTSRTLPAGEGTVKIRYRGWWYYVADTDMQSKEAFHLLRTLVGLRLYERRDKRAAPVLTIPVG